jgi:RNA polymerase sigma-70 factor (ECF subfamily)
MATAPDLEQHRAALMGHCYRMLGSAAEADDAVQETMIKAWRGLDRFEGRASVRTWLYKIATRVCLDALNDRSKRARPMELGPAGHVDDPLTKLPASLGSSRFPTVRRFQPRPTRRRWRRCGRASASPSSPRFSTCRRASAPH